jgi:MFS family permease
MFHCGSSTILSSMLTPVVSPAALGAALALRSLLGFGAGAIAPVVFGFVLDHTNASRAAPDTWGWAFMVLGLGGVMAIWATLCVEDNRWRPAAEGSALEPG